MTICSKANLKEQKEGIESNWWSELRKENKEINWFFTKKRLNRDNINSLYLSDEEHQSELNEEQNMPQS